MVEINKLKTIFDALVVRRSIDHLDFPSATSGYDISPLLMLKFSNFKARVEKHW
jgi:hypothetical protein